MVDNMFIKALPWRNRNSHPNWTKVYLYAKLMESGEVFPPVKVFKDKNGSWTFNDGRHRVLAAKLTKAKLRVKCSYKWFMTL